MSAEEPIVKQRPPGEISFVDCAVRGRYVCRKLAHFSSSDSPCPLNIVVLVIFEKVRILCVMLLTGRCVPIVSLTNTLRYQG